MICIDNLVKVYGEREVIKGISLTIHKGEILGFLGPNGAGKTTTMNIIAGYLSPTAGTVKIENIDILEKPKEAKRKIGYLPEIPPLYLDMTVEEYLTFVCRIKKIDKKLIKETLEKITDIVKITHIRERLIKNLSKGYRQRVGLAQAIAGNSEVLILDEPTVGLDPKEIIEIRNLIKDLGKSHTVLLSSHILSEVSAVCHRVAIIDAGKIAAIGAPHELSKMLSNNAAVLLRVKGKGKEVSRILSDINEVNRVVIKGTIEKDTVDILVEAKEEKDIREKLFWKLSKADIPVLMMKPVDLSLEEVFLKVTKG